MKKISLISSCLLPLLAACSTDGPDIAGLSGHPIYLRAGVDETPRTRSPYVPMDQQDNMLDYPTATHPLHTDVWGSTTPYVFTEDDFDELIHMDPACLFARKFDYRTHPGIVDRLFEYYGK